MRSDFCALILTHGRPDRVHTYKTLRNAGYTGPIYLVIDDEDATENEYRDRYGEQVVQFCKADAIKITDDGDNLDKRGAVVYARNICHDLVRQLGYQYFIELDDDYTSFYLRFDSQYRYLTGTRVRTTLDDILEAMLEFYEAIPALSIAMSQGGDWFGGMASGGAKLRLRRKCMNSFICSIDRPFQFKGRLNEDTTTYTNEGRKGQLFFTVLQSQLNQMTTQYNPGGLTELYLDVGTYTKSFYSVMWTPSSVKVGVLRDPKQTMETHPRLHHDIDIERTYPKILREEWRHS